MRAPYVEVQLQAANEIADGYDQDWSAPTFCPAMEWLNASTAEAKSRMEPIFSSTDLGGELSEAVPGCHSSTHCVRTPRIEVQLQEGQVERDNEEACEIEDEYDQDWSLGATALTLPLTIKTLNAGTAEAMSQLESIVSSADVAGRLLPLLLDWLRVQDILELRATSSEAGQKSQSEVVAKHVLELGKFDLRQKETLGAMHCAILALRRKNGIARPIVTHFWERMRNEHPQLEKRYFCHFWCASQLTRWVSFPYSALAEFATMPITGQ